MTRTVRAEIEPGDTVEVWEFDQLQCRAIVEEWAGDRWRVRDALTGDTFEIPESYLIKTYEDSRS